MRTKRARKPQPDIAQSRPKSSGYADALPGAADVLLLIEVADTTIEFAARESGGHGGTFANVHDLSRYRKELA